MALLVGSIKLSTFKPGEIHRTTQESVRIIKQQINLACEGITYKVSELQTETGVKDRTAQYWIDRALERSSELMQQRFHAPETQDPRLGRKLRPDEQKQIKEAVRSEISAEVRLWVIEQPPERYKKLPQDSRTRLSLSPPIQVSIIPCLK